MNPPTRFPKKLTIPPNGGEPEAGVPLADPSPADLGRRIKLLRVARGLTLKNLEARGGISATHISEIERGRASPTVGALARIARALGIPATLLIERRTLPGVRVAQATNRARRQMKWGTAILEPVTEPIPRAVFSAQLLTLLIAREPALAHHHEGEEWVTVLAGTVEIRIGERTFTLREGDALHFRAERHHSYSNPSSTPGVLLMASRPRLTI